eukprot:351491-Chlamydomonas_euryale.AAC.41
MHSQGNCMSRAVRSFQRTRACGSNENGRPILFQASQTSNHSPATECSAGWEDCLPPTAARAQERCNPAHPDGQCRQDFRVIYPAVLA